MFMTQNYFNFVVRLTWDTWASQYQTLPQWPTQSARWCPEKSSWSDSLHLKIWDVLKMCPFNIFLSCQNEFLHLVEHFGRDNELDASLEDVVEGPECCCPKLHQHLWGERHFEGRYLKHRVGGWEPDQDLRLVSWQNHCPHVHCSTGPNYFSFHSTKNVFNDNIYKLDPKPPHFFGNSATKNVPRKQKPTRPNWARKIRELDRDVRH